MLRFLGENSVTRRILFAAFAALAFAASSSTSAVAADPAAVERGKYLVTIASCHDCHTPGYFLGKPDMARYLGGSDVGFELPGLGVFLGPNLTPDKETGLGNWTDAQVLAALQTGTRPDGRMLAPIMPWRALAALTKQDVTALVAYLRSLPPVQNKVPGPFGPGEAPTAFVMKIVPPGAK
jgi:mono/diheme cytochrome c family protein